MPNLLRASFAASLLFAATALAQGQTVPPEETAPAEAQAADTADTAAAKEVLVKYLTAVKAKKWADAKKFTHPNTMKAIAERKKRLGNEDHPLAPWYLEKASSYLTAYKITGAHAAALGTVVVETSEDSFQVQEKGTVEGENAAYLLGRKDGKWLVVDKKRQETTFSDDSIKLGYKGYFDKVTASAR